MELNEDLTQNVDIQVTHWLIKQILEQQLFCSWSLKQKNLKMPIFQLELNFACQIKQLTHISEPE